MGNMNNVVARMKEIALYGTQNEDVKAQSNSTLYEHANAANGKTYGIVRECNRYYIKYTSPDKANIVESYQYIGGLSNKGKYAFASYNEASKFFEGEVNAINESHGGNTMVESLDPFKKNIVLAEATDKMQNDIARFRQIMHNVAILENASRSNDVVMCTEKNPEAVTGAKGDKVEGSTDAKVVDQDKVKGTKGLETKQAPFDKDGKVNEGCCGKCGKAKCECNESEENDWGSEGMGKGRDPKTVGWDMEGQKNVKEEANEDFSEGLPSSAGVGDADTDHNNAPFNKSVNEGEEDDFSTDVEDDELEGDEDFTEGGDDFDGDLDTEDELGGEDLEGDEDFTEDGEDDFDSDLNSEDELGGEDLEGDEDFTEDGEGDFTEGGDDVESLKAEIEDLKARLAALEGGEDIPEDEPLFEPSDEDFEDDFAEGDEDFEGDDFGAEGDEFEGDDDFDAEGDDFENMDESKRAFMNHIVESVVKSFVNEDELHDFGKHPGYRKKPMTLPPTGEDKNEHGEDWNDESTHSEEPFGKQIGDGDPFNQMVNAVTEDVMRQLKKILK